VWLAEASENCCEMSNQTAAVQRRGGSSRLPPVIEHPMAKMADRLQTPLDVRGDGRSGTAGDVMEGGRPLASEQPPVQPASAASSRRGRRSQVAASNGGGGGLRHQTIPEGVEVDAAEAALDRARQSLDADASPAAAAGDRALLKSSNSSRLSEAQSARLELDEIEAIIKEKVRNNYYEMRKRFTANDPEQKGNVTRDALLRILVSAVGRPVSLRQLAQLFERVGIRRDAQLINFSEFYSALRDQEPGEYPNWMDPIQRQRLERNRLSAEQVHANLSERMRQR
uniref:EF-hand domain-containing protein n=1 Tax=Macrostomum lignano TaxID=282301 RepID=A0A1I8HJU6_9PLAT